MILLFLGLAIVLTTCPLLLVASCKGREDDGGGDVSGSISTPQTGEITGSVSITDSGEIWVSVLLDEYTILTRLEIMGCGVDWTGYRLTVVAVDGPSNSNDEVSSVLLPIDGQSPTTEFKTPQEASRRIIELLDTIGVVISSQSLRSIPHAITCGWKCPAESKQIVDRMLRESSSS